MGRCGRGSSPLSGAAVSDRMMRWTMSESAVVRAGGGKQESFRELQQVALSI
jgi:hypothetical protein